MSVTKMKHAVKINNGFYCSFLGQAAKSGWRAVGLLNSKFFYVNSRR